MDMNNATNTDTTVRYAGYMPTRGVDTAICIANGKTYYGDGNDPLEAVANAVKAAYYGTGAWKLTH